MSMPPVADEIVLQLRLETEFRKGSVKHTPSAHTFSSDEHPALLRSEEIWDIDASPLIGEGSGGVVRIENRRQAGSAVLDLSPVHRVRAVKEIKKAVPDGHKWDYWTELKAIATFNQPRVSC